MQALGGERDTAALGVGEKRIAAVDDQVAGLEERYELIDDSVYGRAGFDHDHGLAGSGERGHEFLERFRGDDALAGGAFGGELLGHRGRPIKDGHGETFALHVEDEIFAHDGKADESDVAEF